MAGAVENSLGSADNIIPGLSPGSTGPVLNNPALSGPPPALSNPSAACQTGGSGGSGGAPAALGSKNNSALTGVDPKLAEATRCGIQKFQERNSDFEAYAFSGVGSRPVAGSKHPIGHAIDTAIFAKADNTLINNLRTNDSPASALYGVLHNNINECWQQTGDPRRYGQGLNFASGETRADGMHGQIGATVNDPPGGGMNRAAFPGAIDTYLNGDPKAVRYTGPTSGAEINRLDNAATKIGNQPPAAQGAKSNAALNSSGANSSAACSPNSSGGCTVSAPGAAPVAAAAAAGAGLGGMLTSALGQFGQLIGQIAQGGLPAAVQGLPAAAQGLAQMATQGVAGASMLPSAVSSVANFTSSAGGSALNAVRGLLPQ